MTSVRADFTVRGESLLVAANSTDNNTNYDNNINHRTTLSQMTDKSAVLDLTAKIRYENEPYNL